MTAFNNKHIGWWKCKNHNVYYCEYDDFPAKKIIDFKDKQIIYIIQY